MSTWKEPFFLRDDRGICYNKRDIQKEKTFWEKEVEPLKITTEEARKVALLSRLAFDDAELETMRQSMNDILTYMEELNQYDTAHTDPTVHAVERYNVMREDVPHQSFTNEEALLNAPDAENGYFKVPKII